jgi:indolepyruvate ferredoxin oxidoreductase alpha subunit
VRKYLLGNAAIARGIVEAGAGLVAGYPGTPSSEIVDTLGAMAKDHGIHVEWSVNEKVALEVAIGASWSGKRSAATMKHVGLNVAADPFMTLAYLGVGAGLVIISADDPYCHSSQNEQDSRRYASFAGIPCLDPADPQDARKMTVFAFDLSEKLNIPVMLRPTTRVSHARADVDIGEIKQMPKESCFLKNPARRVSLPVHVRPLHQELLRKQDAIEAELAKTEWNSLEISGKMGIAAAGISTLYAKEAVMSLGADVSFLSVKSYPAPSSLIREIVSHVSTLLVVEELEPVLEEQIVAAALKYNPSLTILGKGRGHVPRDGELDLLKVRNAVASMMGMKVVEPQKTLESASLLPPRPPVLCPGCSHRATYYAMRKAFGADSIFPSDIGCYTIGIGMGTVDTCLCMGASITLATGIRFGGEVKPICCSIGDSTFLHSGISGLMNAAYNGARITVAILDNSTTAMTGHQPHPGTGITATGEKTVAVDLSAICTAVGAGLVEITDPYDLKSTIEAFKRAKDFPGLSVVIARQECVIRAARGGARRKPFTVNDECTGCRRCVDYGCPAIDFAEDMARINNLCTGCGVCKEICNSGAIEVMR